MDGGDAKEGGGQQRRGGGGDVRRGRDWPVRVAEAGEKREYHGGARGCRVEGGGGQCVGLPCFDLLIQLFRVEICLKIVSHFDISRSINFVISDKYIF
jgi:hypothetical protein